MSQDPNQFSSTQQFNIGDTVDVKRHGKATVVSALEEDPGSQWYGRYQVKYLSDGKTYWARPASMRLYNKPPARLLVAESTNHYRSAALMYAHPDDVVLEVGCHEGVTTDILHQRCKWVLGIDIATDPLARARVRFPAVRFELLDGFDTHSLTGLSPSGSYDKIFIDIGGIAELHTLMSLVGLYYRTFKSTVLIVKNRYFKNLLGNAIIHVPPVELEHRRMQEEAVQQQQGQQQQGQQQQGQQQQGQQGQPQQAQKQPQEQKQELGQRQGEGQQR